MVDPCREIYIYIYGRGEAAAAVQVHVSSWQRKRCSSKIWRLHSAESSAALEKIDGRSVTEQGKSRS